jgi:hypothetical protein
VLGFDWEKECWEGETKEYVRGAHFARLVRTHGGTFISYKELASGNKTPMPSKQQIFILPTFTNPETGPKSTACIQDSYHRTTILCVVAFDEDTFLVSNSAFATPAAAWMDLLGDTFPNISRDIARTRSVNRSSRNAARVTVSTQLVITKKQTSLLFVCFAKWFLWAFGCDYR